jgi:hypothetical protein
LQGGQLFWQKDFGSEISLLMMKVCESLLIENEGKNGSKNSGVS